MAEPSDSVIAGKFESPGTGGTEDDEGYVAQLDEREDMIKTAGLDLGAPGALADRSVMLYRDTVTNRLTGKDPTYGTFDVGAGGGAPPEDRAYRRHFLLMGG